jgi:hypothetical protein
MFPGGFEMRNVLAVIAALILVAGPAPAQVRTIDPNQSVDGDLDAPPPPASRRQPPQRIEEPYREPPATDQSPYDEPPPAEAPPPRPSSATT